MESEHSFPTLRSVVLDTTDARALAEFYRKLPGYVYRPGDEPPAGGAPDERGHDWLVIHHPSGMPRMAFQQVKTLPRSSWPENEPVPQQLHLDTSVQTFAELERQRMRALDLGATLLLDRSHDEQEPLYVFGDPSGHPFCIFVAPQ